MTTVDHFVAATLGVVAEGFLHNLALAAQLVVGTVDLMSAAGRVLVVLALHVAIAANRLPGIVGLGTTATSVDVLWINLAAAADVGGLVVGAVTTAARFVVVIFAFQIALATDVLAEVVDLHVTAALFVFFVHLVGTASAVRIVLSEEYAVTAEMRSRVVGHFAAAAVPVNMRRFRIEIIADALPVSLVVHSPIAAALVPVVVDDATAATGVRVVAWKCAETAAVTGRNRH